MIPRLPPRHHPGPALLAICRVLLHGVRPPRSNSPRNFSPISVRLTAGPSTEMRGNILRPGSVMTRAVESLAQPEVSRAKPIICNLSISSYNILLTNFVQKNPSHISIIWCFRFYFLTRNAEQGKFIYLVNFVSVYFYSVPPYPQLPCLWRFWLRRPRRKKCSSSSGYWVVPIFHFWTPSKMHRLRLRIPDL